MFLLVTGGCCEHRPHRHVLLALLALLTTSYSASARQASSGVSPSDAGAPPPDAKSARQILRQLNNPMANQVRTSIENTWEVGTGGDVRYTLELDPIVPFRVDAHWLLVSRLQLPVIGNGPLPGDGNSGLGDAELSLFASPAHISHGLAWGAGPIFLLPTATSGLGDDEWGAGPTLAFIEQQGGWTLGLLLNHIWSFAGGSNRVSRTLLDPWLDYAWESGFGISVETEAEHDWQASQWTLPLEAGVSQLLTFADWSAELELTGLYFVMRASDEPRWATKVAINLIFGE
jgi:hypothetical protein